ncbi:class I SAM-dependent methyltransferase [Candidatus Sulfurimonas marisnigri]|uniref:Class I SAM-dependent methyltransferase n=1 Tax=Candidatus Sulfurimonas marisnigri TaxID=2740405 RepID=A0A7S7M0F2_9BACT|nr:class I SAM-dependent methyltransferase [Candidatus Sulfurimonas marisnigri]QOY54816.1 class I SAM-dependent methyltransferase [Candidatus Sulfurimonas marisnigri]
MNSFNKNFYTSAIQKYGITAKGVNWLSKGTQTLRFDVILDMLPNDLSSYSIADAGCGFGDFYLYAQKNSKEPKEYIGIDSLIDMYEISSERTGCEIILADICRDSLPSADYYICSGAMNTLKLFESHLFIQNCFSACRYGFIFNVLHGDKKSETYNYVTTEQIEDIANNLNVDKVILRDDYFKNDITVTFLKARD